ncbi:unnamed protein product [Leptosia nina]|uniref:C2H2-type domain-containing protein n=1 Tax=Leptosia nina TaxID=320188 RepID=A0AAV1K1A4_9NEOP
MCVYCCEEYKNPSEFGPHMVKEHPTTSLQVAFMHCLYEGYIKVDCSHLRCKICDEHFEKLPDIAKHLNNDHDKKINFDTHLGVQPFRFPNDKLLCGLCDKNFPCLRQLSRHMTTHYQNFTCEECGKSYTTNSAFQQHIKFPHASSGIQYCRQCKSTFDTVAEKREHDEKSVNCWKYHCTFCSPPKRFLRWTEKEKHLVTVHGKKERTHDCPECPKTFLTRETYRNHFATTHAEACYVCSYCSKRFSKKRYLDEHIVVHTGVKQFECDVCFKTFPRKANLSQHMWTHSDNKRFECKLCDKKFNQKISYRSHMKTQHPDVQI